MNHLCESILEVYVLGSAPPRTREGLLYHLENCAGCRNLTEEMRAYYREVEEELGGEGENTGLWRGNKLKIED